MLTVAAIGGGTSTTSGTTSCCLNCSATDDIVNLGAGLHVTGT